MKKILIIPVLFLAITAIFLGQNKVQAKSYTIEDMDIQATVENNGSVKIEQKITYNFNGSYNGIYINIPYQLEDIEAEKLVKGNKINDDLYNGKKVTINKVSTIINGAETAFTEVKFATNGNKNVYTTTNEKGLKNIKLYSPSNDTTKTFKVDYTIDDLCVKHNDIGELYYNFIGGAWEATIKKLNIDIYIPQNTENIEVWGHGPYNRTI